MNTPLGIEVEISDSIFSSLSSHGYDIFMSGFLLFHFLDDDQQHGGRKLGTQSQGKPTLLILFSSKRANAELHQNICFSITTNTK